MPPFTSKFYLVCRDFYNDSTPYRRDYLGWDAMATKQTVNRDELIRDLCDGQYDAGEIRQIVEVDLAAGTSRDVTREVADECDARLFQAASASGEPHETPEWIAMARYRLPRERTAA